MEAVKSLVQLLFALSLTTTVDARITKLSHADRIALEQQPTIKMLFSTGELPAAVISACATVTADHPMSRLP